MNLLRRHYWQTTFNRVREPIRPYERYASVVALLGGFVIDTFTLNRIDQVFDNLILVTHLLIVGATILLLHQRRDPLHWQVRYRPWLSYLMVFSFGALFSGFVIFYGRSASLSASWPFILALLLVMLATEYTRSYFARSLVQLSVYYLSWLLYLIFLLPLLFNRLGAGMFLVSGLASLAVFTLYVLLIRRFIPNLWRRLRGILTISVVALLLLMNLLYFVRLIPPIPLSTKFLAVYDELQVSGGTYTGEYQPTHPLVFWRKRRRQLRWQPGEDMYVMSAVFAPGQLRTTIIHQWEFFDPSTNRWRITDRIPIDISGGRAQGYRGFSRKQSLQAGRWRVKIQTERRQTLGQIIFTLNPTDPNDPTPELRSETIK